MKNVINSFFKYLFLVLAQNQLIHVSIYGVINSEYKNVDSYSHTTQTYYGVYFFWDVK